MHRLAYYVIKADSLKRQDYGGVSILPQVQLPARLNFFEAKK